MKQLIVAGQHFSSSSPDLMHHLRVDFDIEVFDFLHLGDIINALAGREVAAVISRLEYYEFFSVLVSLLTESGTTFAHCLTWDHGPSGLSPDDLSQIGICGHLDVTQPIDVVVAEVKSICIGCERHPVALMLDGSTFGEGSTDSAGVVSPGVDDEMVDLVAQGFSDLEIAEVLHFSHQTVRNKVSRILRGHGFNNRTDLATARLRHSMQAYVDQSPDNANGADPSEP